jgi:hypothetical protein
MVECNGEREEKREGLTRNTLVVSDRAEKIRGGRKLRRSEAVRDKDGDLQINWSGTNSIRLGMMTRATRRSSWWSRLGDGRSGTAARRWTAAAVLFRCSQRKEKKVRKKRRVAAARGKEDGCELGFRGDQKDGKGSG